MVGQPIRCRCGLYNRRQFLIMNMANTGKQVVFYLVVKSAYKPGQNAIMGREISSINYFMDCPGIFHLPAAVCLHR